MKNILFLIIATLFAINLQAQVPQTMSYQAVARDSQGICVADQTISLQISILMNTMNGSPVYIERFENNVMTNGVGHFQINIGSGTPQAVNGELPLFSDIKWNNKKHFLKIEYAPGASTSFDHVGTTELLTVPYAMVAGNGLRIDPTGSNDDYLPWFGPNGFRNGLIGSHGTSGRDFGMLRLYDDEGRTKANMFATSGTNSYGRMELRGPNGNKNIELSVRSGADYPNRGAIYLLGESGSGSRAYMRISSTDDEFGELVLNGANGNNNVLLGARSNRSLGQVLVRDAAGNSQCGFYVQDDGLGRMFADVKTFIMPHPTRADKDIVYASIEGPEVAAYERGTATLTNGEAEVFFSETFAIVGNHETMTVTITPRSPNSEGLAAFEYTATGFRVKELRDGTGNYKFDWKVEAVRKGYEDWEVIQDKIDADDITVEEIYKDDNTPNNEN